MQHSTWPLANSFSFGRFCYSGSWSQWILYFFSICFLQLTDEFPGVCCLLHLGCQVMGSTGLLLLYFILANPSCAPLSPHSDVPLPAWTFTPRYLSSRLSPHIDSLVLPWLNTSVLLFTARLLLCNSYTYSRRSTQNNTLSQNPRMGDKLKDFSFGVWEISLM